MVNCALASRKLSFSLAGHSSKRRHGGQFNQCTDLTPLENWGTKKVKVQTVSIFRVWREQVAGFLREYVARPIAVLLGCCKGFECDSEAERRDCCSCHVAKKSEVKKKKAKVKTLVQRMWR